MHVWIVEQFDRKQMCKYISIQDLKRKFEHTAQPIRLQTCLSPYPRNLHCLPLLCLLFHLANL